MVTRTITDISRPIITGGAYTFVSRLTRDGATYDLTGKTVTVRIRAEQDPGTAVDASLEDFAATVAEGTDGDVVWTLTTAMSGALDAPAYPGRTKPYTVQFHVETDEHYPDEMLRLHVSRPG